MSRRNVLVLSCMLAALHGQAQAGAQQDPSSNPEIVKLADVSSDCVARHYLTARDAARQDPENRDALLKASLNDAVRRCRREIRLLRDRYEEVFGPGMGYAFLKQSYFPDLKRAVMERVLDTPDRRQQVTALQKNHRYISGGDTDACRYKFLLDKGIQEKVNRVVAGIKLREDLIGKRFQVVQNAELMLELPPDETNGLSFDLNNQEDSEACFLVFKKRMKDLHNEYDRKVKALTVRAGGQS